MENWVIIGLFLACAGMCALCLILLWYFTNRTLRNLAAQLAAIQAWQAQFESEAEEEALKEHERLSSQGQKGVLAREDNRAMRNEAMQEGRSLMAQIGPELLTNPEAQGKAKNALVALALKYPKVAEEVADRLIYEYHAEPYADLIKGIIAQAIQGQLAAPSQAPLAF
jgi:hypothetical protein